MPWNFARADNFANAYYDSRKDQVVVTIFYRGTNPDHTFSLKWGRCKESADGSEREIVAEPPPHFGSYSYCFVSQQRIASKSVLPGGAIKLRLAHGYYVGRQVPTKERSV